MPDDPNPNPAPEKKDPATPPAPAPGEEWKGMTTEQFNARLASERETAQRKLLKDLGAEKPEDIKGALARLKEAEDAKKSDLEKLTGRVTELEPKAKRADELHAAIVGYLEAEEKAIPEDKRALLDLAPPADQPDARLRWIANAKAKGLFTVAAPAAPEKKEPTTTKAGNGLPPKPADAPAEKRPKDMTDDEFREWNRQRLAALGAPH